MGIRYRPAPTPTPTPAPSPTPTPTPPPTSSVKPLWESQNANGKEWTTHVFNQLDSIGSNLLDIDPTDASEFCPRYSQFATSQKKEFWSYLLSAMAKYESSFNPNTTYREAFKDAKGNQVISRGLLQLSIESSQAYGCGIKDPLELHDPYVNLSCGIRILNRWMGRDERIAGKVDGAWRGGARYWSVLRTTSGSYAKIIGLTKAIAICR